MSMSENINDILRRIQDEKPSFPILRETSIPVTDEELERIVIAIGRNICPGFTLDASNRPAYISFAKWLNGMDFNAMSVESGRASFIQGDKYRGIYLAGKTGTGKTIATRVIANLAEQFGTRFKSDRYGIRFFSNWTEARADESTAEVTRTGDVSRFVKAPVLCIQDLGSEPQETLYMGNRIEPLRQILEQRGDIPGQFTIITSNVPIGDNKSRYGERVQSRLYAMCNLLLMQGEDRRRK